MNPPRRLRAVVLFTVLACCRLFIAPSGSFAESNCGQIADRITHGAVVWTENAIFVQGTAAPNLSDPYKPVSTIKRETKRAATLDAYRKAAEVLAGVYITGDRMASDTPLVTSRIQAYVRRPQICKAKYYADGGVDMVVKVPLSGELAQALLPEAGANAAIADSKFSGLVVDAGSLPFSPALAPRLLAPDSRVLFSQENVRKAVIQTGPAVRYVTSKQHITPDMVGTRPLTIRAIGLGPLSPSDLVVDLRAAETLGNSPGFLGSGKIVIISELLQPYRCKDLYPEVKDHLIDWERKLVVARGFGRLNFTGRQDEAVRIRMMERAAEVDARRRLLALLLDIQVDGRRRLKDTPIKPDTLQGTIRNAVRCGARYFRDGTAEVVLAAPIDSAAIGGFLPGETAQAPVQAVDGKAGTGLIIDTTGAGYVPALAPELAAPDGTIVYSHQTAAKGWVRKYGIAGFQATMDAARSDPRIGPRPIIVRARPDNRLPQRLILSAADADKLDLIRRMPVTLRQCRVIIVTKTTKVH